MSLLVSWASWVWGKCSPGALLRMGTVSLEWLLEVLMVRMDIRSNFEHWFSSLLPLLLFVFWLLLFKNTNTPKERRTLTWGMSAHNNNWCYYTKLPFCKIFQVGGGPGWIRMNAPYVLQYLFCDSRVIESTMEIQKSGSNIVSHERSLIMMYARTVFRWIVFHVSSTSAHAISVNDRRIQSKCVLSLN